MGKFIKVGKGKWVNLDQVFSIRIEEIQFPEKLYRVVFYGQVGDFWESQEMRIQTMECTDWFKSKKEVIDFLRKIGIET